ncbi:hypothetical protein V6Z11_D06G212100 [Gossypium hirsutum]
MPEFDSFASSIGLSFSPASIKPQKVHFSTYSMLTSLLFRQTNSRIETNRYYLRDYLQRAQDKYWIFRTSFCVYPIRSNFFKVRNTLEKHFPQFNPNKTPKYVVINSLDIKNGFAVIKVLARMTA